MKRCPYCDEEVRDNAIKCKYCGSMLTGQNAGTIDKRILMPGEQISQQYDTLDAAVTQGRDATILARQYRIVKKIGEGGMGIVYLAEDIELGNRKVAIKVLPPLLSRNIRAVENLRKEALTAIKLNHPNIIRLHGFHSDSEIRFLVMEYIDGQTLEEKVIDSERGRMTFEDILPIAQQIAAALDYAHNQKPPVFHRDLKPSNIMIDKGGKVKLLDFGIAREMKDSYTRVTGQETSGTVPYMCPQQINGEPPNAAMDIYSFAVTLYECMAAHTPFYTGDIKHQILSKRPPEIVDIPGHVNKAIQIALAKQASDRPGTAKELIRLLEKQQTTIDKVDEMLPEAQVPLITPDSKVVVEKIRTWIEKRKAQWNEVEWKDFVISLYNNGHSVGLSRSKLERIRDSEKIAWFEAEDTRKRGRQTQRIKRVGFFILIILITVCIGIFVLTWKNAEKQDELPQKTTVTSNKLPQKHTTPTETKPSNIVVTVNGIVKTEDDLQKIMKPQLEKMAKHIEGLSPESAEQYKSKLRQAAMEYLIAEALLDEKVKEANIVISDEEVMNQIKETLSTQKPQLTLEEFKRKAAEAGRDFNEIKQQIEKRITYQKLLNTQWAGKINITEEDAKKYYDENPAQFEIKEQVRASHILIKPKTGEASTDPNQEKAKAKAKAEELLKQIKEGADFAALAKANSDCPSAKNGGDLNYFSKGQMVQSFENAAFELEIGQVSDIVETRYGYHIVKVTDYKAPGIKTFVQSKDDIIKDLTTKKQSELYKQYIESLKKKANIIYPSVSS